MIEIAPHLFGAPAKVNLFLDVRERRADGYHDLTAVNISASLVDFMRIESAPSPGLHFTCNLPQLPVDQDNSVVRGVHLLLGERLREVGLRIHLHKCIPTGAGLGGGTADAAVAMVWLNDLLHLDLSRPQLLELGARIGADVPYSMVGGAALVEGIGERVTPLGPSSGTQRGPTLDCWLLIVDPGVRVATPGAFSLLSAAGHRQARSPQDMIDAVLAQDVEAVGRALHNSFQPVMAAAHPPIGQALERLRNLDARASWMTGSGSHVLGIFDDINRIHHAQDAFAAQGLTSYIARPDPWPWTTEETCHPIAQQLAAELE